MSTDLRLWVKTKAFGMVEGRVPYGPAPIRCEGECGNVTMHEFVERRRLSGFISDYHDFYSCKVCGRERIWG